MAEGLKRKTCSPSATFGAAYMTVVLVEPLVDLALLAAAKAGASHLKNGWFERRLLPQEAV